MAAKGEGVFEVAAAIVTVALITVIVSAPQTAAVVTAIGNAFAGALRTSLGKGSYR